MKKNKIRYRSGGDRVFDITSTIIFIMALIVALYPMVWMVLNSFRTSAELFREPLGMPAHFDFTVFPRAWKTANLGLAFKNSILVTGGSVLLQLTVSSLAAFAVARLKFKGAHFFENLFTFMMVISGQVILIPLFFVIKDLKLYDSLWSVILAGSGIGLPIPIMLLTSSFRGIPNEIEESTMLDGCSHFNFFLKFALPLSKPILATLVTLISLWTWNEYLYSLTFLKSEGVRTIPLKMNSFTAMFKTDWAMLFAALTLSVIPLILVYLVLQKYFIKGLTAGAVKS